MGTSSMYTGPSRNPLLPKDFEDTLEPESSENEEQKETIPQESNEENGDGDNTHNGGIENEQQSGAKTDPNWSKAKSIMSRYASGGSSNYRRVVSNYVKAYGGARNAAKSAVGGIRSTASLGHFLVSSSSQGIRETLAQFRIDYDGRAATDILTDVLNQLAPVPVTKEDSVARKALIRTMEVLYSRIEDENNDIRTLDKIDKDLLNELIPIQIESYIYERIINDLGSRIETKSSSPSDAVNKEKELREYINSKVETTLRGRDFTQIDFDQNISKDVENLYRQCYKVMEDML